MTDLRPDSVAIRAGRADNGTALAPVLWGTSAFVTPSRKHIIEIPARTVTHCPHAEDWQAPTSNSKPNAGRLFRSIQSNNRMPNPKQIAWRGSQQ